MRADALLAVQARAAMRTLPYRRLEVVEVRAIEVPTYFHDFHDCWSPFLGGRGPAPSYAVSLSEVRRAELRERIRASLPGDAEGGITLSARAWAIRSVRKSFGPLRILRPPSFREVNMALQGHLEAMKMEEVVAWPKSAWAGAAKPVRSVTWEPCGYLEPLLRARTSDSVSKGSSRRGPYLHTNLYIRRLPRTLLGSSHRHEKAEAPRDTGPPRPKENSPL